MAAPVLTLIPRRSRGRASGAPRAPALVGRGAELARIGALFDDGAALVTLLGPPGVGKTALALRVAERAERPVWFCDLQAARDEAGLCLEVSGRLGQPSDHPEEVGALLAELGPALIVLDNVEQLGRLPALRRWLELAKAAAFLVTSRERLALPSERVVELAPLEVEGDDAPAVRLFLERLEAVAGRGAEEREAIREIVRAVDGLPLAIELAAARTRLLPPTELLARLRRGADVLSERARVPPRHRSVADAVAWSWRLLEDDERDALARLSVFSGPFPARHAEELLSALGFEQPIDVVASLRDKSLLHAPSDVHLGLYEVVRSFARSALAADPERHSATLQAHATVLARACDAFVRSRLLLGPLHGAPTPADVARLAPDLIAALARAEGDAPRLALLLGLELVHRRPAEWTWARLEDLEVSGEARAHRELTRLRACAATGDRETARAVARALDVSFGASSDATLAAAAWVHLGIAERQAGDIDAACASHARAQSILAALPPSERAARLAAVDTACRGRLEGDRERFEDARELDHRASEACIALGEPWLAALGPVNLAQLAIEERAFERAEALLTSAVEAFARAREPLYRAVYAAVTAGLYFEWGRLDLARRWYATLSPADALTLPHAFAAHVEGARAVLEARLGEPAAAAEHLERARRRAAQSGNALGAHAVELASSAVALLSARSEANVGRARALLDAGRRAHTDTRVLVRLLEGVLGGAAEARLFVAPDASVFRLGDAAPVNLGTRGALRRVLLALLRAHASASVLSSDAVFAAGWPGQTIRAESASMRVRGAIATLRKMGLREQLVTVEDGYRLSPALRLAELSET